IILYILPSHPKSTLFPYTTLFRSLTNIVEGNYDTTRTNKVTGYKVIETSYIPAKLSDYHEDSYKVGVEVYTEQHNINKAKNHFNRMESEIYDNYAVNVAGSEEAYW